MPASARPVEAHVPPVLIAAAPVLDQAAHAIGWLDDDRRLRWANASMLSLIGGHRLPSEGLAFDDFAEESGRLTLAASRAQTGGGSVRVPGLRLRPGGLSLVVQITALDECAGLLVEASVSESPTSVPVAASLRSLAHELKNPLGGLRGAAQLLSRRVLEPDLRAYAEIIVAEVDRLRALTERLLVPATGRSPAAVNVHGVLERVRLLLAADGAQVQRDYDPSLPECTGEGDRLVQVFLNIARNAVEADATSITLRTRYERSAVLVDGRGAALRIDIEDDGLGIPDSLRNTLFLPLVSGREGGTGLGLATASEIVREHGGRIDCHSRPRRTVFSVWLPVASEAAA